jgi:hypothetical protein
LGGCSEEKALVFSLLNAKFFLGINSFFACLPVVFGWATERLSE